jgi:hypothetical protein
MKTSEIILITIGVIGLGFGLYRTYLALQANDLLAAADSYLANPQS